MIVRPVLGEFAELVLDDRKICHKIPRFHLKTCLKICCKSSVNWIIG